MSILDKSLDIAACVCDHFDIELQWFDEETYKKVRAANHLKRTPEEFYKHFWRSGTDVDKLVCDIKNAPMFEDDNEMGGFPMPKKTSQFIYYLATKSTNLSTSSIYWSSVHETLATGKFHRTLVIYGTVSGSYIRMLKINFIAK